MKIRLLHEPIKKNYCLNLLRARGIENIEEFLHPVATNLQDWRALDNMKEGVALVDYIRTTQGKMAIIVDCDVDGYTSASILYQYFKLIGIEHIDWFIQPAKQHGLEALWQKVADKDFYDLIVIPDAGSNDREYAKKFSCPVLVIDHHILEDEIADNMTLINNQESKEYKNKHLSGAGMAYQFCRAFDEIMRFDYAENFIDLAALGVCADMMSGLETENQYLWKKGFSNIKNYFFKYLCEKQSYSMGGEVNPTTVAFYIAPMINAMIRVGTQAEKERLFMAFIDGHHQVPCNKRGAKGTFEEVAIESARECTNAKNKQNKIKEEVVERLEQKIFKYDLLENQVLFIRLDEDDSFPPELNGLVAMQLSAKYKKPTIVARLNNEGYIRGSIRGLSNCKLSSFKDFLESTHLFEYVQGHDNAAGCSILNDNLDKFHRIANEELQQYELGETFFDVDFSRLASDKDLIELIYDIAQYGNIWSQQNNEPLLYVHDIVFDIEDVQVMGKTSDTVKIVKNDVAYMKFHAKDLIEELRQHKEIKMHIVGRAHINEWNGITTPQIFIDHYEIEDATLAF